MAMPHIGYTSFGMLGQNNTLDAIALVNISVPIAASMGVAVQGSESAWPGAVEPAVVPKFDKLTQQRYFIEVFNRGLSKFDFTINVSDAWVSVSSSSGTVVQQQRVWVSICWDEVPTGATTSSITITGAGDHVAVRLDTLNPSEISRGLLLRGFAEGGGYVSIEAEHFTALTNVGQNRWSLGLTTSSRADVLLEIQSHVFPVFVCQLYLYLIFQCTSSQ